MLSTSQHLFSQKNFVSSFINVNSSFLQSISSWLHPKLNFGMFNISTHTGSKFEMDVATFGLDFLEECTTQGRTRSPSDGVPLFQGSFCSIIPWPIRWHEYDTLQMILGIFRHHGAHSCRLSGSNNLLMWLAQHGCLRTELNQFVANS